jgi:flagellar biogenesis protein FliO
MPVCLNRTRSLLYTIFCLSVFLTLLTPCALSQRSGGDSPPPSATILSITDLPDSAGRRKAGAKKRVIRPKGRAFARRPIVITRQQRAAQRRQALLAKQRERRLAAARAARQQERLAAKREKEAAKKPQQVAQKITDRQNAITQKAAPPVIGTTTSSNPTPQAEKPGETSKPVAQNPAPSKPLENKPAPATTAQAPNPNENGKVTLKSAAPPQTDSSKTTPLNNSQKQTDTPTQPTVNPNVLKDAKPDPGTTATTSKAQPLEGSPLNRVPVAQVVMALFAVLVTTFGVALIARRYIRPATPSKLPRSAQKTTQGGGLSAMLGGMFARKAQNPAGSNIHIVETMPTGNNSFIHLVEIHGKRFVVGATPWHISMLTEIDDENLTTQAEFRDILRNAASELMQDGGQGNVTMSQLDDQIRETNNAVVHNIERIRNLHQPTHSEE